MLSLCLSTSILSFPLKNKKKLFMASFERFIVIGTTSNGKFLKNKNIIIKFSQYEDFFDHIIKVTMFLSSNECIETNNEHLLFENCVKYKWVENSSRTFEEKTISYVNQKSFYPLNFDLNEFYSLINAYRVLILPSLKLSVNINKFFLCLIDKEEIELTLMKNQILKLFEFINDITDKKIIKAEKNEFYVETFLFYYETIIIIHKLKHLD